MFQDFEVVQYAMKKPFIKKSTPIVLTIKYDCIASRKKKRFIVAQ
jgi:hypothetical protein